MTKNLTKEAKEMLEEIDKVWKKLENNEPCSWDGVGWDGDVNNFYGKDCVESALLKAEQEIEEEYEFQKSREIEQFLEDEYAEEVNELMTRFCICQETFKSQFLFAEYWDLYLEAEEFFSEMGLYVLYSKLPSELYDIDNYYTRIHLLKTMREINYTNDLEDQFILFMLEKIGS